ncbi:MAG TPA: hypothetical protein VEZ42_22210, partial [Pseudonocardia sp.]|nr:hypothetical protein [Pseudonocardia sp.]
DAGARPAGPDAARPEPPAEQRRDRPAGPEQPTSAWDGRRPEQSGPSRPWEPERDPSRNRDAGSPDSQPTGQWSPVAGPQRADRGQPPRAFPPGPELGRSTPPHAQSPHAGSAPLPGSALPGPLFGGPGAAPPGRSPFDQPTGLAPVFGRPGAPDPNLTGPIDTTRLEALGAAEATARVQDPLGRAPRPADPDDGPPTAVGVPPTGAEDWHRSRTGRPDPAADEGPPTEAAAPMDFEDFDRHPAGLGPPDEDRGDVGQDVAVPGRTGSTAAGSDGGPADPDDEPESAVRSWVPVLAQWIIGAVGGAALWVGFRYLWSSLLVVAIAAAVLVIAGLVVVVRTLLRNNDLHTTLAAVAVGVLLTVSPAVLVLLGR